MLPNSITLCVRILHIISLGFTPASACVVKTNTNNKASNSFMLPPYSYQNDTMIVKELIVLTNKKKGVSNKLSTPPKVI